MSWYTAIGAWGDCFASGGNILTRLVGERQPQAGIVYYGFDPDTALFFAAQPWVREVRHVMPAGLDEYRRVVKFACTKQEGVGAEFWKPVLAAGAGVEESELVSSHVDLLCQRRLRVNRWREAALPEELRQAALVFAADLPRPCYLLNPFSTQSVSYADHWPQWSAAIKWLAEETDAHYLLVGKGWESRCVHPRLLDYVERMPSMLHVLALAEVLDGIITTSNGLSMWSVMQGMPAVVALNQTLAQPRNYFRLWITAEPNRIVSFEDDLNSFTAAYRECHRRPPVPALRRRRPRVRREGGGDAPGVSLRGPDAAGVGVAERRGV